MVHTHANPINSDFKENNTHIPIIMYVNNVKTSKNAVIEGIEQ